VHYGHVARDVAAVLAGEPADLIETVAGRIADAALARERVRAVEVTVHKPQAPITVPFTDVAVTVERSRPVRAVIALGANLGDRRATLARALEVLDRLPDITVVDRSPVVETVAVGAAGPDPARPRYLNQVAALETGLGAADLLAALHAVEHAFGRERGAVWADRTLDLDLITMGELELSTPALTVPHPLAHLREFVLGPWVAMDPEGLIPGRGRVADLLARLAVPSPASPGHQESRWAEPLSAGATASADGANRAERA